MKLKLIKRFSGSIYLNIQIFVYFSYFSPLVIYVIGMDGGEFLYSTFIVFFFEIQLKYVNEWWLLVRIRLRDFHFNCFYFNEIYFYGYFFQIEGN